MNCSKCGYNNSEDSKFCENCGNNLVRKDDSNSKPTYILDQQKSLSNQPNFSRTNQSTQFSKGLAFNNSPNNLSRFNNTNISASSGNNNLNNNDISSSNVNPHTNNPHTNNPHTNNPNQAPNQPSHQPSFGNGSSSSSSSQSSPYSQSNQYQSSQYSSNQGYGYQPNSHMSQPGSGHSSYSNSYQNNGSYSSNNSYSVGNNPQYSRPYGAPQSNPSSNYPTRPYGNPKGIPSNSASSSAGVQSSAGVPAQSSVTSSSVPSSSASSSSASSSSSVPSGSSPYYYSNSLSSTPNDAMDSAISSIANGFKNVAYGTKNVYSKIVLWPLWVKIVSVICTILIITVPAGLISYYNWVNRFQMPYGKLRSAITQNVADNYKIRIVGSDVRDYPHVKLYFSVTDNTGESLEIESPTAAIKEKVGKGSDIERRIRNIERIKDKQGVGYEIMLDKSYSMYNSMDIMKNTMKDFVRALNYKVGDKAEVISFDTYLMYMASYTKDEDNLLNGIDNMEPYGNTALYDALYTGVTNASKRIGANCVIAFTDGEDNMSQHSMDDVISFAKDKGIPIYLIGTADANTTYLQTIAEQTGGYFWNLKFIKDMSEVLDRIKANQDNVYCLEYDSDSSADPYADRVISALLADSKHSYSGGIGDDLPFNPIRGEKVQKASYTVHKGDVTWTEANAACMQDGAHLATIPTKDEEDKLIQLAEENDIKYVWIGGYTSERPNGDVFAHWITGEKTTYTNWMQGEPSRNDRDGSPEFYLMLWKVGDQWSWNDERDNLYNSSYLHDTFSGKTGYICKVDSKN